ncbi:MAG TPA: hypothetical protein VF532_11140 [Candidatus Angelobacter sp.]
MAVFMGLASGLLAQEPYRPPVILGILEELPSADAPNAPKIRGVQVLFKKAGKDWIAYPHNCADGPCVTAPVHDFPQEVIWTISFDGKNLGQVTARSHTNPRLYWRDGQQEITSKAPIPTVGKRSLDFGGQLEIAVYRPLVAVSQPNFRDPDQWKPAVVAPNMLSTLQQGFRHQFPKLCRTSATDDTQLAPFPYGDEEIKLVKSYPSKSGWTFARLHLEGAIDCEDTEAGFDIDDPWFVVDDKSEVRYLDSGMFLVDAGDYDADGKSEVVFSINSDNRGGYRIFYDDFRKKAEFKFSYH